VGLVSLAADVLVFWYKVVDRWYAVFPALPNRLREAGRITITRVKRVLPFDGSRGHEYVER
jgi:hypothetical protein